MSKQTVRIVVVLSLLICLAMLASCGRESEREARVEGVEWLASLDEALAQAEKKGQPIMIDVYADWCRWCKVLDSDTYTNEDVVAKAADFVSLKLDADANRSWVMQYQIGGLPTILFIDADGKEIHRVVGYRPPEQFVNEMETALSVFKGGRGS
jgi:thiol:disulfide interchange protein